MYVDIDAHHGDGVEEAFIDDPDVLTLSLHMDTAYAYPFRGGKLADCGSERGGHTTINVPLPTGTHDAEYRLLFEAVWQSALEKFRPDAVVLQAGTDLLANDPLGKLSISTEGFLEICNKIIMLSPKHPDDTPRLLVTGGGGYHPLLIARAWTGLWALLSGRDLPLEIPAAGAEVLRAAGWHNDEDAPHFPSLFMSRVDRSDNRPVRDEVRRVAAGIGRHPFFRS
jgi:acetoin utilization protein AcuC